MNGFGLRPNDISVLANGLAVVAADLTSARNRWDGAAAASGQGFAVTDCATAHQEFQQHLFDVLRTRIRAFEDLADRARDSRTDYTGSDHDGADGLRRTDR
ncbi:hypothetical protein JOF53_003065 [Crossiella equi]|uniref:ESX-1 secretion-associated protein n=1 Tax=Crossiella equi TaxID=130796 RepID=A0ABS5AC84_9PSEU|nr:type VII secretion target [Crossiella equi]MBP2474193.1 hypothetical protein [Crossiella equi]